MFKKVHNERLKKISEYFLMILAFAEACFYKYWMQQDVAGSGSKYSGLIKPSALVIQVEVPAYNEDFNARKSIKLFSVNCNKRPSHFTHSPHIVGYCMT